MTDELQFDSRQKRFDKIAKQKKNLTLSPESVSKIQLFADQHVNGNFSAAMEVLALNSLGDDTFQANITFFSRMVQSEMMQQQNRFAKLMATAAIEAGKASGVVDALLLLILGEKARELGSDFNKELRVGRENPLDRKIRAVAKSIQENGRKRAVERLKKPLDEIGQILVGMDEEHERVLQVVQAEREK